ncbi:MAG: hypothetical protein JSW23_04185 [Planctomycetota bacterium]|nr:MAG: hypothetical protein JSW23_04185 [Planctomycetota bacterium]
MRKLGILLLLGVLLFGCRENGSGKEAGADEGVIGVILEDGGTSGTVTGNHGAAIHGGEAGYDSEEYLGRFERGAEVKLLERDVIKNEFKMPIIKVKALEASGTVAAGAVGWVILSKTSFAEWYESRGDGVRMERVIGIVRETKGTKGTITGKHGASMKGSGASYNPELYLGGLKRGARIELVDVKVIESKFGQPIIKVKALTGESTVAMGSIGWVNLADTSFAESFVDETEGGGSGEEGTSRN